MQVTETVSEGLKREFQITVPAADLEARLSGRLAELKDRVQLRGFRPGGVPVTHLRKVYGRSVMAETVETVIHEPTRGSASAGSTSAGAEGHHPEQGEKIDRVHLRRATSPTRCRSRCCRPSRSPTSRPSRSERHHAKVTNAEYNERSKRSPSRTSLTRRKARAPRSRPATAS